MQVRSEGRNNPLNKGHKQFDKVVKGLKDRLLGPKIAFFVAMGDKIEPFLTRFQSNDPMAPLLFRELTTLTIGLLELVVKDTVLSERTSRKSRTSYQLLSSTLGWPLSLL